MSVARRAILKGLLAGVGAGPSITRAVVTKAVAGASAVTAMMPQASDAPFAYGQPNKWDRWLDWWYEDHGYKQNLRLDGLDPDIWCLRSVSRQHKVSMQGRRNAEHQRTIEMLRFLRGRN